MAFQTRNDSIIQSVGKKERCKLSYSQKPLYDQAQRAAAACGLSLEKFVADAVQLRLNDNRNDEDGITLTLEQIATIQKGQAEIKAGKFLTMEQMHERSAAKKAAWLNESQP